MSASLLVDGHVHYHDAFDAERFLDAAAENFDAGARELRLPDGTPGCLLFTESAWDHAFRRFRDDPAALGVGGWKLEASAEPAAVRARGSRGHVLWLVAGRQVVTSEGLEVLALVTDAEFADGRPIGEALARVRDAGAVAGIPWGFGKWWFGRGALVEEVVRDASPDSLFLGDNGGRPQGAREHRLFRLARERGLKILPGSDPLPFAHQASAAGSYGFRLAATPDPEAPATSIARAIRAAACPDTFGRREGPVGFVRDQVAMQLRNRTRSAA